jgi:hypothetical protein
MLALFAGSGSAIADPGGFWDPGLQDGGWRTDYASPVIGTAAQPLGYVVPCLFPETRFAICPTHFIPLPGVEGPQPARVFSRSNWTSAPNHRSDRFWLVTANVEPALDSACNSGPPDQSEPIVAPFEGVFGVRVQPATGRPYRNEVVLAVDLSHRPRQLESRPNCRPRDFIPFLGFGIYSERGAGGQPLALLADEEDSPVLRFDYRLVDSNAEFFDTDDVVPARPRGQYAGFMVEAQWAGRKHAVWVDLFNAFARPGPIGVVNWNWAVRDSFYYPGAEIAFASGPTLRETCGSSGFDLPAIAPETFANRDPVSMRVDLRRLYECVGDQFETPFPRHAEVPLTGVQFFVEVGVRERDGLPGLSATDYDSRLGVAVSDIDIVPAAGSPTSSDAALVAQLGRDLLGREWSTTQRAHWRERLAAIGRAATIAEMLRTRDVGRTLGAAAKVNLIGFGLQLDRQAFEATLAALRGGDALPSVIADLADSAEFARSNGALDNEAFVRRMFRRALGDDLDRQPDADVIRAGFGSIEDWTDRLARAEVGREAVLLDVYRLAVARGLLDQEADVVALYRGMAGVLPDAGGIGAWRLAADMPMRLAGTLYHAGLFRDRFAD